MLELTCRYGLTEYVHTYRTSAVFVPKNKWSCLVKEKVAEYENNIVASELNYKVSLHRYSGLRRPAGSKLWFLALNESDYFYDISYLIRVSTFNVQSKECLCGTYAYDIVKHVCLFCLQTECTRERMFNSLIDLLDVETFVSIWNDDDDLIITFLLGGIPNDYVKKP